MSRLDLILIHSPKDCTSIYFRKLHIYNSKVNDQLQRENYIIIHIFNLIIVILIINNYIIVFYLLSDYWSTYSSFNLLLVSFLLCIVFNNSV